ncbi:MAG: CBS domain-containing protein [Candidatus Dormibacteraeota bacterium]|nr:CBS domain-containing protein [Candidatus Dormibacteraeota bacterium]
MKVREAMAKTIISGSKGDRLIDVARKMKDQDAGFLPIVEGGRLIGVVTDRDIVVRCVAEGHDLRNETAEHVMSKGVTTVAPDDDLADAARKMENEEIRRLAVVDNGSLVGVLSHGNVVQAGNDRIGEQVTKGVTRGA